VRLKTPHAERDEIKRMVLDQGRRPARGKECEKRFDGSVKIEMIDRMKNFRLDLKMERHTFLRLPRCAHPRTKSGGMRSGFVVRVMRGMRHRLRVHHPA
jgi:hypothetical protein